MSYRCTPPITTPRRSTEAGGIVILLALILLSIMTVAAIGVSQGALREAAITGNESTGRKASEAADAGIDWAITWANPEAFSLASTGAAQAMQNAMSGLLTAAGSQDPGARPSVSTDPLPGTPAQSNYTDYGILNSTTGSLRVFLRSGDADYQNTALFLTKPSSGNTLFKQTTSQVVQAFDLEVRYLGAPLASRASGGKAKKTGNLFLIHSLGRANITDNAGKTLQSFIAQREAIVEYTPD